MSPVQCEGEANGALLHEKVKTVKKTAASPIWKNPRDKGALFLEQLLDQVPYPEKDHSANAGDCVDQQRGEDADNSHRSFINLFSTKIINILLESIGGNLQIDAATEMRSGRTALREAVYPKE